MSVNKGQVLALTIFMLFIFLGVVVVLLMPINQQVIRVGKLFSVFRSLTAAETGIEIGNLYLIKNTTSTLFNYTSQLVDPVICQNYFNFFCLLHPQIESCNWSPSIDCPEQSIDSSALNIKARAYILTVFSGDIYSFYTKVISQAEEKGITRVLDFDFAP